MSSSEPARLGSISLLANVSLAGLKMIVGLLGSSFALIADGIESLADVLSSFIVRTGLIAASKDADHDHPFGHGKAEAVATMLAGVGLLVSAVLISVNAIREIITPHEAPKFFTVPALIGIILVKEWLHHILVKGSEKHESTALKAEAWHHRADALTSLGVLAGIAIAIFAGPGFEIADDVAALVVSVLIVYNAFRIVRPAIDELMDRRVEDFRIHEIEALAEGIDGIEQLETVLLRRSGRDFVAEIHMEVDPGMSVAHAHELSHELKKKVQASEKLRVVHAVMHIEPFGGRFATVRTD